MRFLFILVILILLGCTDPTYLSNQVVSANQSKTINQCKIRWTESKLCLSWFWLAPPSERERGQLLFKIYRPNLADGTAVVVDASFLPSVTLWMPSMNHGSTPVNVTREDVGTYRASHIFFIMPGEWQIRFQIKDRNEVIDEAIVDLVI